MAALAFVIAIFTGSIIRQQNTKPNGILQQPYNHIKWYKCMQAFASEEEKIRIVL